MIITLADVFEEALEDGYALNLNSPTHDSVLLYSCKISKERETGYVVIENIGKGGDYYKPVEDEELDIFLDKGCRHGVYAVSVKNYMEKLESIESRIQQHLTNKKPDEYAIKLLKNLRTKVMKKYNTIKRKLNKLNQ